jgi:biopolymer transport protein ExbD
MARKRNRGSNEVNAGSMADIAFLLLIFFLVTTQIATNKGLTMVLPPKVDEPPDVPLHERNILAIQLNSQDKILVEKEILADVTQIREMVYDHVLNFGNMHPTKKGPGDLTDAEVFNSLTANMKSYINNNLRSAKSSDNPRKAVVSIKTDRGSSYELYIKVMDEVNAAYYRIYGEKAGLTSEEFRKLNRNDPRQRELYENGKLGINKAISLAEPTEIGG